LPDKITIYRRPIEMRSRTIEDVRATVLRVVKHEIAHHFGIGDDRLREIGAY
jgi:predicted Zn-dependent protease with MMP-like domain